MLKMIFRMLAGALLASAIGVAYAQTYGLGRPPLSYGDEALIDQKWLYALSGGRNLVFKSGITAAGSSQTDATALPNVVQLIEVDTTAASTGVNLPTCLQGTLLMLYNNGLSTLTVYPAVANNPVTAAQDKINNGTTLSGGMATHTAEIFFCPKNGVWAAK